MSTMMKTQILLQILENNNCGPEFCDNNTPTNQVQLKPHPRQYQQISSTQTKSLKLPTCVKEYFCLKMFKN